MMGRRGGGRKKKEKWRRGAFVLPVDKVGDRKEFFVISALKIDDGVLFVIRIRKIEAPPKRIEESPFPSSKK